MTWTSVSRRTPFVAAFLIMAASAPAQTVDGYVPDRTGRGAQGGLYRPPGYPLDLRNQRAQVVGTVRVFYGKSGKPDRVAIVRYTGSVQLMQFACAWIQREWQSAPRTAPDGAKGFWRDVPITFVLAGGRDNFRDYVERVRGKNSPEANSVRDALKASR